MFTVVENGRFVEVVRCFEMAIAAGPKFFDIVTKPNFDLYFTTNAAEPCTIDISIHNPNHATTLAYYVRITHPADFIVVPSKGLLEPVDNKVLRVTRRPNAKFNVNGSVKIIYTEVPADTPRVDLKAFENQSMQKKKELIIKHENPPNQ